MNKSTFFCIPAVALVCVMLVFTACRNPVSPKKSPVTEYGTVRITFDDGPSRTIYPTKAFDAYVYTFTPDGGAPQVLTPVNGAFMLESGDWNVRVDAYVGAVEPANLAASGEANFTLAASENKVVSITLAANETSGAGTFSWHILYPAGTTVETFTLRKLPGLTNVALNPQAGERTMTGSVANVPAGVYQLDIRLANDGLYAGANEIVYIYVLLTTEYGSLASPVVFEGQDFLGVFTDLDDIAQYLDEHTGGTSAANPILLPLAYDLGIMTQSDSGWWNLLDVIAAAGKYVALDLSACTMNGTEFNPARDVTTGKDKIVSIDLPDVADSIAGGGGAGNGSFNYFSSLTAVTAKYVLSIGNYAFDNYFDDVPNLTSVSLPTVISIGYGAFAFCTGLESVSFSASADVGVNPFYGCLNLTTITLFGTGPLSVIENGKALVRNNTELVAYPAASGNITMNTITTIGENALQRCTNLTGVSFPAVTSIGYGAFRRCFNLESISFAAMTSIPSLGSVFEGITGLKNVEFAAITSIGDSAFTSWTSLESVSFAAATSIGNSAFSGLTSLESVSIPAATSIGDNAFYNCTSLTSVEIPASADIYYNPFGGCINLTTIAVTGIGSLGVIEDGKVLIRNGTELVAYPTASGSITMNAITRIGNGAFDSCTGLESVSFPAVTSIGSGAFRYTGGTALTVILGATPPTLGTEIFYSVSAKNVTVRFPLEGAVAYGAAPTDTVTQNWGNAFRGMGWDGTSYLDGTVNDNIYLFIIAEGEEVGMVTFVYYWVNEQDVIATAGGLPGNAFSLPFGDSLTITANGGGYTGQRWYIDGVEVSAQAGNATYTFTTIDKTPKRYTVGLIVEKGGKYYNVNFAVTVE